MTELAKLNFHVTVTVTNKPELLKEIYNIARKVNREGESIK